MKKALVIGGNGFVGYNLVKRLKSEDWWVKVVDLKKPEYGPQIADLEVIGDASETDVVDQYYDRIYQLAADMGGAGFIFTGANDADILTNSSRINSNVAKQAKEKGCGVLFYSSSVCVYADGIEGREEQAWPANPVSNYGIEKLFSEQLYLAYAKNYGLNVKIARFHNCFGPYGTYKGGREKAPAAICRKVIESDGTIEVWGDGEQQRPFIYIDDLLDGIEALIKSDITGPVNLGPSDDKRITVNQLVATVAEIAGKGIETQYVDGPTGELNRHANNDLAREKLEWSPKRDLRDSLKTTYEWIKSQYEI